jgi:hypothetical protein
MKKSKLQRFIAKYHLGGNVPSIILTSESDKLSTRFVSQDRSLLGEVTLDD